MHQNIIEVTFLRIRLKLNEIITERGISRYKLQQMLEPMSYRDMKNLLDNPNLLSIRLSTIERLCTELNCHVSDLFEEIYDEETIIEDTLDLQK